MTRKLISAAVALAASLALAGSASASTEAVKVSSAGSAGHVLLGAMPKAKAAHYTTSQDYDRDLAINKAIYTYCASYPGGSCYSFDGWNLTLYTEHTRRVVVYWTTQLAYGTRWSCHSTIYVTHGSDRPDLDVGWSCP